MECKRCYMNTSIADVELDENGVCNFCKLHDSIEKDAKAYNWPAKLEKIRKQKGKYHCLLGISGGLDSSVLLYYTVKVWGLNPLVIHFDNHWNSSEANHNIEVMIRAMNVDFIRYYVNYKEYNDLNLCFLLASVSDADIPNDMAMAELMLRTANKYKIKYIFNGHNYKTEGSSPLSWSYMDAKYLQSVYKVHNQGKELKSFPLLTFWRQLYYSLTGLKRENPLYHVDLDMQKEKERLMKDYGWKEYGGKHAENIYTEFIGSYYLPVKFGIDKRITYNSALVRSGKMPKTKIYYLPLPNYDVTKIDLICQRLGISRQYLDDVIMKAPWNTFEDYETYHKMFRRYKALFYILVRLHLLPRTFYIKYCR